MTRPIEERFWEKVEKTDGCWIWRAYVNTEGYGRFSVGHARATQAHRFAFKLAYGYYPKISCHSCGNRCCVRPDHIIDGDYTRNAQDTVAHGRHFWANKTHCIHGHELTPENVYLFTQNGNTQRMCRQCRRERNAPSAMPER